MVDSLVVVSVVIPAFNSGLGILACVESVLLQNYPSFEVVVVDDCSTDNTFELLSTLSDRVTVVRHEVNRGGAAARNTGVEASSGSLIALLDADDVWAPSYLTEQVSVLTSARCSAVYCHAEDERGNELGGRQSGRFIRELLLGRADIVSSSALLVRRDVYLELNGFDEAFSRHQDLEFVIRLMKVEDLVLNPKVLFKKINSGSPSYNMARDGIYRFWTKFDNEIKGLGFWEARYVRARGYLRLSELSVLGGLPIDFLVNFCRFLALNPLAVLPKVKRYFRRFINSI